MVLEDFTTYTEVDNANNRITVVSAVEYTALLERNDAVEVYLYKDYTLNHFTNLNHLMAAESDFFLAYLIGTFWATSNHIGGWKDHIDNNKELTLVFFYRDGGGNKIRLQYDDGVGGGGTDDYLGAIANTIYYFKIIRSGVNHSVLIYSDSARTILLDTIAVAVSGTATQYLYVAQSRYTGTANRWGNIIGYDLDLQESTPTTSDKNIPNFFNSKFITHH